MATMTETVGRQMAAAMVAHQNQTSLDLIQYFDPTCHAEFPYSRCRTCQQEGKVPRYGTKGSRKPVMEH